MNRALGQDAQARAAAPEPGGTGGVLGLRLAALAVIGIGAVALVQTLGIPQAGGYSAVGPRAFPLVVSIGLLVIGTLFGLRVTVWPDRWLLSRAATEEAATHWPTPLLLGTALLAYAFLLPVLGYILATAAFLPTASRILGSRALVRDLVAGIVAATVLFFTFTEFLRVRLPAGLLDPIL